MFQIEKSSDHANAYYDIMSPLLHKRIKTLKKKEEKSADKDQGLLNLLTWFCEEKDTISNLQRVITAEPEELDQLYQEMTNDYLSINGQWAEDGCVTGESQSASTAHQVDCLHKIFNYDVFSKDKVNAYKFVENTGVHICPYCNQEFVFSIKNQQRFVARSDLDHYLPKSRFPMFALSYYNLIPSGGTCNSNIKGARELDIRKHFHPYIEDKEKEKLTFRMEFATPQKTSILLDAGDSAKGQETIDFFRLNDVYQIHTDESDKLLELYETYPPDQLEHILKLLQSQDIPIYLDQLLHILYAHYDVKEPESEIMGNLRHDLFEQIKGIYKKETERLRNEENHAKNN